MFTLYTWHNIPCSSDILTELADAKIIIWCNWLQKLYCKSVICNVFTYSWAQDLFVESYKMCFCLTWILNLGFLSFTRRSRRISVLWWIVPCFILSLFKLFLLCQCQGKKKILGTWAIVYLYGCGMALKAGPDVLSDYTPRTQQKKKCKSGARHINWCFLWLRSRTPCIIMFLYEAGGLKKKKKKGYKHDIKLK